MLSNKRVSPSRTYIAICNTTNFNGYRFRRFKLPQRYENDTERACWYFLNRLDQFSCIDGCYTAEEFSDLKDVEFQEPETDLERLLNSICGDVVKKLGRGSADYQIESVPPVVTINWAGHLFDERLQNQKTHFIHLKLNEIEFEIEAMRISEYICRHFAHQFEQLERQDD